MSDVAQSIVFVECPTVLFQEAKAHLVELNRTKAEVRNGAGAISIEANSVRGMTDSIPARGQSLDPNAVNILQYFLSAVNGVGRQEENSEVKAGKA